MMKLTIAIFLEAVVARVLMGPTCPEEEPDEKLPCVVQNLVCQYGEVACCDGDEPVPEVTYACIAGKWDVSWLEHKCGDCEDESTQEPVEPTCPEEEPEAKASCFGKGLSCSYGEWSCCGESHPEVEYKCSDTGLWESTSLELYCPDTCHSDNTNTISVENTNSEDVTTDNTPVEPTCTEEEPELDSTCVPGLELTCGYGEMECCGESHPEVVYTCADTGKWTSSEFQCPATCETAAAAPAPVEAPIPVDSQCPEEEPEAKGSCTEQSLVCGYGELTCCGKSYPEVKYTCSEDGSWTSSEFRCPKLCMNASKKTLLERLAQLLVDRVHEA